MGWAITVFEVGTLLPILIPIILQQLVLGILEILQILINLIILVDNELLVVQVLLNRLLELVLQLADILFPLLRHVRVLGSAIYK